MLAVRGAVVALFTRRDRVDSVGLDRLEERHRTLVHATEEWRSLLREMEGNGESADPRYERYYIAYVEAKTQEKRADLELFNVRAGLRESQRAKR